MAVCFDSFLGNEEWKRRLAQTIDTLVPAHAYLITGEKGSGKATLARLICQALACESEISPCHRCTWCRKIEQSLTPDIITVTPEDGKVQINVDQIRSIRHEAVLSTCELGFKAFIITPADAMNDAAQNALLKLLEEPPPNVYFFLLSDREARLLPTVRSRVQHLKTEPLPTNVIEDYLLANHPRAKQYKQQDPEAFASVLRRCTGSIGQALSLLGQGKKEADPDQIAKEFLTALAKGSHASLHALGTASTDRVQTQTLLSRLLCAVRDLCAVKKTQNAPCLFFTDRQTAMDLSRRFTNQALTSLSDAILDALRDLSRNANVATAQLTLCERAWSIRSI